MLFQRLQYEFLGVDIFLFFGNVYPLGQATELTTNDFGTNYIIKCFPRTDY